MLVCIGEILVDIFKDDKGESVFPGGAPFNVASNAVNYTKDVYFVGAVGNDDNGRMLIEVANKKNFVKTDIQVLDDKYTTRAIVTLNNGERDFRFERDGGADYNLNINNIDFSIIKSGDIVHIGSLMLSYPSGIKFFKALTRQIRQIKGVLVSFDVNYRDDIFQSQEEAKKIFVNAMRQADIIKLSEEELYLLSNDKSIESSLQSLFKPQQIAVITLGRNGSMLYHDGMIQKVKSIPVKPVDTTGAGDAFYSYFLASLLNHPGFVNHKDQVNKYMLRSNIVGAIATLKKGAIGVVPSESQIDEFLNNQGKQNTY